jgi:regulatory protein
MQLTQFTPVSQLALPFPAMPFPIDNRGMNGDDETKSAKGATKDGAFARGGARKRGTFESNRASSSQTSTRPPKVQTPAEAAQKLRNKALRLLTTREHSREELMRKLAQAKARHAKRAELEHDRRAAKDDIEKLVDDLAAQGWQSDDRYAEAMVRRLTGQASKRYIAEKLAQAGIKKEVVQQALVALEQDDFETATALWTRRFGEPPSDDRERQRHIRFLLSRGFHLGDAFKIVPRARINTSNED